MSALAARLESLLGHSQLASADTIETLFGSTPADALPLAWPELDAVLPDGGLPRGVTELTAPHALGGGTSIAIAAVRAAQERDAQAWCAWVDPEGTLYAPGLVRAGVDLRRLLVVRPPRAALERAAVRVASTGAFDVVVVDADPIGALPLPVRASRREGSPLTRGPAKKKAVARPENFVRKLALLAEEKGGRVLLLTAHAPRRLPLPVALRLELVRRPAGIDVRVGKDRRGRIGVARAIAVPPPRPLSKSA
jgi:recombination protein RecA